MLFNSSSVEDTDNMIELLLSSNETFIFDRVSATIKSTASEIFVREHYLNYLNAKLFNFVARNNIVLKVGALPEQPVLLSFFESTLWEEIYLGTHYRVYLIKSDRHDNGFTNIFLPIMYFHLCPIAANG